MRSRRGHARCVHSLATPRPTARRWFASSATAQGTLHATAPTRTTAGACFPSISAAQGVLSSHGAYLQQLWLHSCMNVL